MQINFYRINDEHRQINKTLGTATTLSGSLTNDTSLINPVIRVKLNNALSLANYCYIPAFNRYYYITDITLSNQEMIITLHCDVLMSFKNDILTSKAQITRTYTGNKNICDPMILQTSKVTRQVKRLGSGFSRNEMYIVQIGG